MFNAALKFIGQQKKQSCVFNQGYFVILRL